MQQPSSAQCSVHCDYCGGGAVLTSSAEVYGGRDYGPIYLCRPCGAWVGCHPGTTRPLGRLANAELRLWKQEAHAFFDPIWKKRLEQRAANNPHYTKGMARGGRYKRLAALMGLSRDECHIGMFDVQQCQQVIELCRSGALDD